MRIKLVDMINDTKLLSSVAESKRQRNIDYLMELKVENLLMPYYIESGLHGSLHWGFDYNTCHGGWDSVVSHIRGTFTGHWLSAAARIYDEIEDMQLKAKADYIVNEIAKCQEANGGQWAFPIPEKYLYALKEGKHFWAPQYVCHKLMMGLLDMYQFAHNEQAYSMLLRCADWFYEFSGDISRVTMDMMMDIEESGALMELWADLYAVTKDDKHLQLMKRYERPKLTDPLFEGKDVLTNMHANTTIPEIHGCARAYEVTGEERYRTIVENYWECAVTNRGQYATGGQTNGEVWTSKNKQTARLGKHNQEHCVVYNMIRLANYLYTWTGETKYSDYIEQNIYNGLFVQGFPQDIKADDAAIVAYYLPLAAGSKIEWGSKTKDFWCCHCTVVQANARYREYIYYKANDDIVVSQYMPSELNTVIKGVAVKIEQTEFDLGGHCIEITDISQEIEDRPQYIKQQFKVKTEDSVRFAIKFRLPWWLQGKATVTIDGKEIAYATDQGYGVIEQNWTANTVVITLPKEITAWKLPDEPNTIAFLDGPVVLVGVVNEERILVGDIDNLSGLIKPHNERMWTSWTKEYKTVNQQFGFYLKPLNEIVHERYVVYFPIKAQ